jgi:hypothetical protein
MDLLERDKAICEFAGGLKQSIYRLMNSEEWRESDDEPEKFSNDSENPKKVFPVISSQLLDLIDMIDVLITYIKEKFSDQKVQEARCMLGDTYLDALGSGNKNSHDIVLDQYKSKLGEYPAHDTMKALYSWYRINIADLKHMISYIKETTKGLKQSIP